MFPEKDEIKCAGMAVGYCSGVNSPVCVGHIISFNVSFALSPSSL